VLDFSTGGMSMSKLTALISFIVLSALPALAQTPPAGSPPAGDAGTTGGFAAYWWVVVLVVIVAAAIWYFSRNRSRV
jgi:hypothetical protein